MADILKGMARGRTLAGCDSLCRSLGEEFRLFQLCVRLDGVRHEMLA